MIRRFLEQAWLCFKGQKAQFELEEFLLFDTLYPFATLAFYCVVAGYSFQTTDVTDWVIGNAFLLCINSCIFSLGNSFSGERYYGRIRSMIVSPASRIGMVLEKGFFVSIETTVTTFIGFLAGCFVFDVSLKNVPMVQLVGLIFLSTFAAAGFGLFIGIFGLVTDQMHFILNVMNYILLIFCGAEFPVAQLPRVCQMISQLLPLTRSIAAAQLLVAGDALEEVAKLMIGEVMLAAIYFCLGAILIRIIEKLAVKNAVLEVF